MICVSQHWAENIPRFKSADGRVDVTLFAGNLLPEFQGTPALAPPPNSYASDPANEVGIYFVRLLPGGQYTVPAAKSNIGSFVQSWVG